MPVSQNCIALVKASESCRLTAYPDPGSGGDPWTIGWGSTGPDIRKGVVWTQSMADNRLMSDLNKLATAITVQAPCSQNQLDALVDFAYNEGIGNLFGSTLWRKHRSKDFKGAAVEFSKWDLADGHVMNGLITRREKERELYVS